MTELTTARKATILLPPGAIYTSASSDVTRLPLTRVYFNLKEGIAFATDGFRLSVVKFTVQGEYHSDVIAITKWDLKWLVGRGTARPHAIDIVGYSPEAQFAERQGRTARVYKPGKEYENLAKNMANVIQKALDGQMMHTYTVDLPLLQATAKACGRPTMATIVAVKYKDSKSESPELYLVGDGASTLALVMGAGGVRPEKEHDRLTKLAGSLVGSLAPKSKE